MRHLIIKKTKLPTTPLPHVQRQSPYLLQEELLWLDSCCASSSIFSMSPLWMEEEEGTCSKPPTKLSSSSSGSTPMTDSPAFPFSGSGAGATEGGGCASVLPLISSSTQETVESKKVP